MTYWHMQLHPNNLKFENEINILQQTNLIGLGDWEDKRGQIKQFSQEMKVGDIVLIKRGGLALSLVEVVGEMSYEEDPNEALDWFPYRRKIKVLSIADNKADRFPQPRGTLSKSINSKTKTYQYINNWYNKIVTLPIGIRLILKEKKPEEETHNNKTKPHLFGLFIEKYKMFDNLTLSFVDNNNEPLPVIVLAGINGSGKTTLLEYIDSFSTTRRTERKDYIEIEGKNNNKVTKIYKASHYNREATGITEIRKNIRYFPIKVNSVKDTGDLIIEYANKLIRNGDYRPSEAYTEIRKKMRDIFTSLNLKFTFSRLDEKDQIFFNNEAGAEFPIDALSTGEKTLLANLFSLYIGDYSGKVILIDEPETSLHPSWQHKIIRLYEDFCKTHNSQVIIATHSSQIIGSAKNDALKILSMRHGKIKVIDNLVSYGRDSNWILSHVMGSTERNDFIIEEIEHCQQLLAEEKYEQCETCLDTLENKIGANDPVLLKLKNILFFERD